jgi:hypothetical protein
MNTFREECPSSNSFLYSSNNFILQQSKFIIIILEMLMLETNKYQNQMMMASCTWRFDKNMPELVRTSLVMLSPDSLSATVDFANFFFAYK